MKKRIAQLTEILWQFLTLLDFFTALLNCYNEAQKREAIQDVKSPLPLPLPQEAEKQLELRILKRLKKI